MGLFISATENLCLSDYSFSDTEKILLIYHHFELRNNPSMKNCVSWRTEEMQAEDENSCLISFIPCGILTVNLELLNRSVLVLFIPGRL